jgi:hypothetical protein
MPENDDRKLECNTEKDKLTLHHRTAGRFFSWTTIESLWYSWILQESWQEYGLAA